MALLDDIVYGTHAAAFDLAGMTMAAVNDEGGGVNGIMDKIACAAARPWKGWKFSGFGGFGHCSMAAKRRTEV